MERVLATARVSKYLGFSFLPTTIIPSEATVIVADSRCETFSIAQSTEHKCWVQEYQSSLETRGRYTPSDCFETFPLPSSFDGLDVIGQWYYDHRCQVMLSRQEGLTKTYNRFHDPDETAADIQRLRDLHVEMDHAVAAAYGWTDLGHGFHETKQGTRFTISESARREVLGRLLKLNHERYAEEVRQGLNDKKGKAKKPTAGRGRKSKASLGGDSLFGDGEDDPYPTGGR